MFSRAKVLSIATAAFLLLTAPLSAQTQGLPIRSFGQHSDNTLTISVHDKAGQPIADARVDVRAVMSTGGHYSGYTNRAGMLELTGLGDGTYEVAAQKGVVQSTDRVEVGAGLAAVALRIDTDDPAGADVGSNGATVSLAQYKVPKKAREEFKKAESALNDRKTEEAEKHLAKALEIHPEYADALTMRGIMNLEQKNYDAAISDLDHAIKADPGYAMAYIAMGATFNMTQRFDEALQSLDRGVALAPQSWQAYFEMAKAQVGKSSYEAAIRSADKAQAFSNGTYPLIHLLKAHAMLALKQYDPAMGELQAFLDQAPKAPQAENARTTLEQVRAFVAKQ